MSTLSFLGRRQRPKERQEWVQPGLLKSQLILFNSRRKWGLLYSLATVAGLFSVPGAASTMAGEPDVIRIIQSVIVLPMTSLLIATGMYILNDIVDADLDRANGKKRPIPSGLVSKRQAWFFVASTNIVATVLAAATLNIASILLVVPMLTIGIMYSAPRVALMNRFVVKTLSISVFYVICALLGITSTIGIELAFQNPIVPFYSLALLGIMIFISSTLNDLGDIDGDRAAKRRTIPVVLGATGTITLLILLASTTICLSVIAFGFVAPILVALSSAFFLATILRLKRIRQGLREMDVAEIRRQHKKIFPMHMLLQLLLGVSGILASLGA